MNRLGSVDPRFQSYNVEMVEVIGGRFWKPYGAASATPKPGATGLDPSLFEQRQPINLADPRLRKLARALGPTYVRVSGSWANTVYFQNSDAPAPAAPPQGFGGVLTRAEWKGVLDFVKAVDGELVTSFSTGAGTRDANGVWTPTQAKAVVDFTNAVGGHIAAAEFMNEPTFPIAAGVPKGYDAAAFGRDFQVFHTFFRKAAPHALLLGPGSVGEGYKLAPSAAMMTLHSDDLLRSMGSNPVDVFSYHFYGAVSERCRTSDTDRPPSPDNALSEDWLARTGTVEAFYAKLRDTYAPGKPMWNTETGQTACGGDRWASTFVDSFRYLDQLGWLAKRQVKVVMHNTLAASDYALIDEKTLTPRPNYWAALLWHDTMGTTVLDPGAAPSATVHLYAHCMKGHPGGVSMLALNLNRTEPQTLRLPTKAVRYTLSSPDLLSHTVQLNGKELALTLSGDVPVPSGTAVAAGNVRLPATSITFLTFAEAGNAACR